MATSLDARLNASVETRHHSHTIRTVTASSLARLESAPLVAVTDNYQLRLATTPADVRAAQRLRFEVFNLELGRG